MFVGHTAIALAAKAKAPAVSLAWLVAAAFALDLLWPIFLLLGIERVSIVPGATVFNPLVFDSYPWSHSLLMACVWGLCAAGASIDCKAFVAASACAIAGARRFFFGMLALTVSTGALPAGDRTNYFDDPFLQVTDAIPDCPKHEGSRITQAEMRTEAHVRAERGLRCFESGRCRLPSSYMYDKEIIPRVKKAILADGRFSDSSIWVEGKRRWVWLKGCVRERAESAALEQLVRMIDDVEHVINQLVLRNR